MRGERSVDGNKKKKSLGGSVSPDIWDRVAKQRELPVQQQPAEEKQSKPQIIMPDSSRDDEALPELILSEAFSRAGYVNWAGYLAEFGFFKDPSSMECALSVLKEEDGWKFRRHARFMGDDVWGGHLATIPKETHPLIIKNAAMGYTIRAAEQVGTSRRIPHELYKGAKPNISDKLFPYLTPVFMEAGKVTHFSYKQHGVAFNYRPNTPCALLIRPLLKRELRPDEPVPNNVPWEITRFILSGNTLHPEATRILREGLHHSQIVDGAQTWDRDAATLSNGKMIIPGAAALKDLSANLVLVDTCIDPQNLTRGRKAAIPNPPSQ